MAVCALVAACQCSYLNGRHLANPAVWGLLVIDGQTGTSLPTGLEYLQKFGMNDTLTGVSLSTLIGE